MRERHFFPLLSTLVFRRSPSGANVYFKLPCGSMTHNNQPVSLVVVLILIRANQLVRAGLIPQQA